MIHLCDYNKLDKYFVMQLFGDFIKYLNTCYWKLIIIAGKNSHKLMFLNLSLALPIFYTINSFEFWLEFLVIADFIALLGLLHLSSYFLVQID